MKTAECVTPKSKRERNKICVANWQKNHKAERKIIRQRYSQTPKGIYLHLRKRGKENVSISKEDFIKWYFNQKKECFYCELPENKAYLISSGKMTGCKRLTIDRFNPKGKYSIDNICLACVVCNMVKSDVFTPTEMSEVGKIINKKWKKLI